VARLRLGGLLAGALACGWPLGAFAGPHDFVVAHSGVGGDAAQAAPYLDTFLRFAEGQLKWPAHSASGKFFPDPDGAVAHIKEAKPAFGMLDPELYLELRKKEDLTIIATVSGKNQTLGHYSVVVEDPAVKTLEDLKGKVLISNHLQSPKFLSKVVFEGKLDAATHFKLSPTLSPLKGLKAVDRGEAAATLLDDEQLANIKTLPFGAKLRVIYTSPALPPMPLVAFGKNSKAEDRAALAKMLFAMCSDPKGNEVCQSLQISKFSPPDAAQFEQAVKRFEK
jgi:ABC-type phosphate/phosphonate transport system substrate-binding protein